MQHLYLTTLQNWIADTTGHHHFQILSFFTVYTTTLHQQFGRAFSKNSVFAEQKCLKFKIKTCVFKCIQIKVDVALVQSGPWNLK